MMRKLLALSAPLLLVAGIAAAGCGDQPGNCEVANGVYQIALPDGGAKDAPVLLFLHGYGGNAAGTLKNARLRDPALARGYAVIAPEGLPRNGTGPKVWNFFPGWAGRDEAGFLKSVIADASKRFGTSPDRVLLGGFSAGAFMVTYLACGAPETFTAYAPVSGGFWRPQPQACEGPVKLLQTHGWRDTTVPLEGRMLAHGKFRQGDIFAGLQIWRAANECADEKPSSFDQTGQFWRRKWTNCAPGSELEMALFNGGHKIPKGWTDMALDWFEQVTATN